MSLVLSRFSTALLICGSWLVLLSQWLKQDLPIERRATSLPLTAVGLLVFLTGALLAKRGRLSNWLDRVLIRMGKWLSIEAWQIALLFMSLFSGVQQRWRLALEER
jgi:hypothetical protein